jgi:hypothetical protein
MSSDALPPSVYASRSLMSFVQELDNYDPEDCLTLGSEETKELNPEIVLKYLRCLRGFMNSARSRIIEARLPAVKEQLAVLQKPFQQLNERIFRLERDAKLTPDELRSFLNAEIKSLLQWREQVIGLANELDVK